MHILALNTQLGDRPVIWIGSLPIISIYRKLFFSFSWEFFWREREIWTHVKNCERNCFLTIFLKFSIKKYFCCDIFQSHFENIYCIKRLYCGFFSTYVKYPLLLFKQYISFTYIYYNSFLESFVWFFVIYTRVYTRTVGEYKNPNLAKRHILSST